ncbi:MAG: asparagine synthase (glutamine-hydrolyzing) [Oscillospiraceae bacterium]|nr:asparagine synthase (glutamine-hydrolyzing) [Oscillospiraceae bacterium]
MCGICGFSSSRPISRESLSCMNGTLRHRGPDDGGIYITAVRQNHVGLAHRRLSVLDLSASGHQPMLTEDGGYAVVFNGEIYNYESIRKELEAEGEVFQSRSDTEVLLKGWRRWGEAILPRCNGMFAFAVLNRASGELFLARDRMGVKPLFYYLDGDMLLFASELKAIIACPEVRAEVNTNVLPDYLYQGYISGEETVYKNVYRLLPGHCAVYSGRQLRTRQWWALPAAGESELSYEAARQKLKELLFDAVKLRMISDVPLGSFLSGGIDSSLITAVAARCSAEPLKTYTIGFRNRKYDESVWAAEVAKVLKTEHHMTEVADEDFEEMLDRLSWYYDEPFADPSEIPTMLVSKAARQDVTVVLSGDAGDELFGGYNNHATVAKYETAKALAPLTAPLMKVPGLSPRLQRRMEMLRDYRRLGSAGVQLWEAPTARAVLDLCGQPPLPFCGELPERDAVGRRMRLDCMGYLPDDILVKVDRASMSWSLEARCPLLDYRLVEFAFSLPQKYKYAGGVRKKILKDVLYDFVPKALFERPKQGFKIPLRDYLGSAQREKLLRLSSPAFLEEQGLFRPESVSLLLSEFDRADSSRFELLWNYYIFQLWYERHIRR